MVIEAKGWYIKYFFVYEVWESRYIPWAKKSDYNIAEVIAEIFEDIGGPR